MEAKLKLKITCQDVLNKKLVNDLQHTGIQTER